MSPSTGPPAPPGPAGPAGPALQRLRVLSVSPTLPWPPDHGTRIRAWHLLRRAAADASVTVAAWRAPEDHPEAEAAISGAGIEVISAPLRVATGSGVARAVRLGRFLFLRGDPPFVQALREERAGTGVGRRVAAAHAAAPFDVVVAEVEASLFLLADLLPASVLGAVPIVLHRHNVFAATVAGGGLRGRVEAGAWRRFDRAATGDVMIATTPESAEALEAATGGRDGAGNSGSGRIEVVPNGVEPGPAVDVAGAADVAFIGTLDYAPNVDAVAWFVQSAWDDVRLAVPGARLRIIGRLPPDPAAVPSGPGISAVGYVDDLAAGFAGVRVGVVPLRHGMGIKNKTLDFLAHGIPVVSTPAGAEAIGEGGGGVVLADDAAGLAAAVTRLLTDGAEAAERGRKGREFVVRNFSWDAIAGRYLSLLTQLARCP